jgi:hypothetical protein
VPYGFGHDTRRCPFIDDTPMDGNVPYLDWYLNSNCGGKTWFPVIKVEGNESSICRVDCPHSGK